MQGRQQVIVGALGCLLAMQTVFAAPSCIISSAEVSHSRQALFVDIRPLSEDSQSLPSSVISLTPARLLSSRVFRHRDVVLFGEQMAVEDKQALCDQLKSGGYRQVAFLKEPASALLWRNDFPVMASLEHSTGSRWISPREADRWLALDGYQGVVLGHREDGLGWDTVADQEAMAGLVAESPNVRWLVFAASAEAKLDGIAEMPQVYLVEGGLHAWKHYQSGLMQFIQRRDQKMKMCRA